MLLIVLLWQDITSYVYRDPNYPAAVGGGAAGDVYRAIYNVSDAKTQRPYGLNVRTTLNVLLVVNSPC
jgi:hypothetical protein